jgi:hypothetical protein
MYEEFTTMAQVSAELRSMRQLLESRDNVDLERRKLDDKRDEEAKARAAHILERVDGHGGRIRTLEVNWATFFSENGAFTFVKKKVEACENQNRVIIGLVITTLGAVIANIVYKH